MQVTIREFTVDDIPVGMELKSISGWNQTESDWRRFFDLQPDGCFIAQWQEKRVGTATTCVFDTVGWIGMMLVHPDYRGRGIGNALLTRAIEFLESQHVRSIRLDATPMGRPLYTRFQFHAQFQVVRFAGIPRAPSSDILDRNGVQPLADQNTESIIRLDRQVVGVDRRKLLARLLVDQMDGFAVSRGPSLGGYTLWRSGANAVQVGPCIASSARIGRDLFSHTLSKLKRRRVHVDIPADNVIAANIVRSFGLEAQRKLTRMCRGEFVCEDKNRLWASSGPEKG